MIHRDWHLDAICTQTDPDLWFPEKSQRPIAAITICHQCPAQAPCLEEAITNYEPHGIWGGTTPTERREIRRQRRQRQHRKGIA